MYTLNPLRDPRWNELLLRHPAASVFHSPEWLEALWRTYDYEPVAWTTCPKSKDLTDGVPVCSVNSWLTGCRLVSVPFSDHCEPLVSSTEDFERLLCGLKQEMVGSKYKYIEFRPLSSSLAGENGLEECDQFSMHKLDLGLTTAELFHRFHKDCVQRKIQRAEREHLIYEEGHSAVLLRKFYELQVITRRRQHLPAQPFAWFRNLAACMGNKLMIRVVSKDHTPIAGLLTLTFRRTLIYKYGGSNKAFSNLGGMQLLFWRAIQDAKREGLSEFDLGRSDPENEGLIRFKDRLGSTQTTMTYRRYFAIPNARRDTWKKSMAKPLFSHLPKACLQVAGNLLYKHIA